MMITFSRALVGIVSSLFFLSGFASLVYEVIWFKRFTHVWGNSTLAQAVVLVAFLFGLSFGAYWFGRWADKVRSPLLWYCICEALIGVLALLVPAEISVLNRLSSSLYPYLNISPVLQFLPRFLLTLLVIGPPCMLMGGTLPLMVRHFLANYPWGRETTGWLYAFNTLGAAMGCLIAGFYFLPLFGMIGTNWIAIALNWIVAGSGCLLLWMKPEVKGKFLEESSNMDTLFPQLIGRVLPSISVRGIYIAAAMAGCASLILQVVWTRKLAVMLGGTTYAFSAMLFVFLFGIALGSLFYSRSVNKIQNLERTLLLVISLLILSVSIGFASIPPLTLWLGYLREWRADLIMNALIGSGVSMVLQFLPTFCMGFLFPFFVDLVRWKTHGIGSVVGNIYAWNTGGSILGVFVCFFLLIPMYGTYITAALAMSLYLPVLFIIFPNSYREARRPVILTAIFLLLVTVYTSKPINPLKTDMGLYLYGYDYADTFQQEDEVIYFKEGGLANVLVTRFDKEYYLRVNGKIDATKYGDMRMQKGLAYFSLFYRPEAKDILVIGYGSGSTAGACLLFPDTKVTCCEIEPVIFEAGHLFADVNHRPYRSPNFTMVSDDGRSYLEGCGKQFDLILSEPSNPWMAGISNLFTREFYIQVREQLRPGGILTQWIHTYHFSLTDYCLIARTILDVFPHAAVIRINESDTLFLVSDAPLVPDLEMLETAQSVINTFPAVQSDLQTNFGTSDVVSLMLESFFLSEQEIHALLENDPVDDLNTDLDLRLEFYAPLRIFLPKKQQENVDRLLMNYVDPNQWINRFRRLHDDSLSLSVFEPWLRILDLYEYPAIRQPLADYAMRIAPDDPDKYDNSYLLAEKLIASSSDEIRFQPILDRLLDLSVDEAYRAAVKLWNQEKYRQTIWVYQGILQKRPDWVTGWTFLALSHAHLQEWEAAGQAFTKAQTIDSEDTFLNQSLQQYKTMKSVVTEN